MTREVCTECRRPLSLDCDQRWVCHWRHCGEYLRPVDGQLTFDLEPSAYLDYEDERVRQRSAA